MATPGNVRPIYVLPTDDSTAEGASRISMASVGALLWESRYWLAVFGVLGLIAGFVLNAVSTRIYHAETLLVAAQQDRASSALGSLGSQVGGLASLAGISGLQASGQRTETLAVLSSQGFIAAFIVHHNLMPILYAKKWNPITKTWMVSKPEDIPTLSDATIYFSTRVMQVEDDKKTGLITVAVEWRDREVAAQWANALVADLNADLRGRAVDESGRSVAYLNQVLQKGTIPEVAQQAVYGLIETQLATAMMANVRKQYALKVLDVAVPPDADHYVRPNLFLFLAGGLALSLVLALIARYLFKQIRLRVWKQAENSVREASL